MNTQENAKALLASLQEYRARVEKLTKLEPILQAAAEGKAIQVFGKTSKAWYTDHHLAFDGVTVEYRVKRGDGLPYS